MFKEVYKIVPTKRISSTKLSERRKAIAIHKSQKMNIEGKEKLKLGYKSQIHFGTNLNMAYFKIFSDFFNILQQHSKERDKFDIHNIMFIKSKQFLDTLNLDYTGETDVIFKYKSHLMFIAFDKYRQRDELHYTFQLTSKEQIELDANDVYNDLLKSAMSLSDLKGSYIEMPRGDFSWKKKDLEKRTFEDIFLPANLMDDLRLYVKVFQSRNKAMRYLMVGSPGTGKTESTLIIANELHKAGVTVIKTAVCPLLKEKLELAQALAPTIILFDDLDLSIGSRTGKGYSPNELQTFLDALDGTDKLSNQVGIIATTNSAQLLDLAAQRPGRFEKILCFDGLNKKSIGSIILKSLRYNFNINATSHSEQVKMFFNKDVVEKFFKSGVTGAHVFNSVNVLKLKADMSDISDMSVKWVLNELQEELTMTDKIKKIDHLLENKIKRSSGNVGFGADIENEIDDNVYLSEECQETIKGYATEIREIRQDSNDTYADRE